MNRKILKLLYRSFDDELSAQEQSKLDMALAQNPELQGIKDEISARRKILAEGEAGSFGPYFAERVMSRIRSGTNTENGLASLYDAFKTIFRRFVLAGALVLLILFTYNLSIGDKFSAEEAFYASDTTYTELLQLPLF